jgi:methyl-accepting chemotaxis protein
MSRWPLARKLIVSYSILGALGALVGFVFLIEVRAVNARLEAISSTSLPSVYALGRLEGLAKDLRGTMRSHIVTASPDGKAKIDKDLASLEKEFADELSAYSLRVNSESERAIVEKVRPAFDRFIDSWNAPRDFSMSGNSDAAMSAFMGTIMPAVKVLMKSLDELTAFKKAEADRNVSDGMEAAARGRQWAIALIAIIMIAGAGLALTMVRAIGGPLGKVVTSLSEASSQIAGAAGQMAAASQSLAQSASEEANSMEQAAAQSGRLSVTTGENSRDLLSAAQLVEAVGERVRKGGTTLSEMTASMTSINNASKRISQILKTIEEIAFQTNILALNAAVEAARAGAAGAGFAVVADEVRNLAQRSSQAARDTASLVDESISSAQQGRDSLNRMTVVMEDITKASADMNVVVTRVAESGAAQSETIASTNQSISELQRLAQDDASVAEETAAAGEELAAQSASLRDTMRLLEEMTGRNADRRS